MHGWLQGSKHIGTREIRKGGRLQATQGAQGVWQTRAGAESVAEVQVREGSERGHGCKGNVGHVK